MSRNALELLAAVAALPPGTVAMIANSGSAFTVTFSTPPAAGARRTFYDRATNVDLQTAIDDELAAAILRIGGNP